MPAKKEETKKKAATQMSLPTETSVTSKRRKHDRAGLLFPVTRVLGLMKEGRYAHRISPECAIGVAAVLEYLTAEILETAGDSCYGEKGRGKDKTVTKSNIKPRHICLAVRGDEELGRAIGPDVIIPMGGVIPFIHEELSKKLRRRKRDKAMDKFKDDQAEDTESGEEEEEEEGEDSTDEDKE